MKRLFLLLLLVISLAISAQKVNVAAAANLKFVLEEIKNEYVKLHPKSKVNVTFGSSGALTQQIISGAGYDFFVSADNEFPQKLKNKGMTVGKIVPYAKGKLVLYSTSIEVSKLGLEALKSTAAKKIAIANPETAPYGERAIQVLKKSQNYENAKRKLMYGESISQAAQFTYSGSADLGFIALSLALAPEMKEAGSYYLIPEDMYEPIIQSCVLLKTRTINTESSKFMKYMLGDDSKPIWKKWGYETVNN